MRLTILFFFLLGLGTATQAQTPPFEKRFIMPGAMEIHGADMDSDGNYYFATVTDDDNIQVTKITAAGEHEWTYSYPYFVEEGIYGDCLRVGPNGIVLVGYAIGSGTNGRDGIIMHIGMDGTLIDSKRIDSSSSNALHYLERTSDGFIATGRSGGAGSYDLLLAKLDEDGNMLWSRTYGTPEWDWAYQAIPAQNGGYIIVGASFDNGLGTGTTSGYIVRTDALGNELWARSLTNGTRPDELYCVAEANDGSIYVGGRSLGFIGVDISAFVTKLSSTGQHLWTRALEHGIETWQLKPGADNGVDWLIHPQYFPGGGDAPGYDIAWGSFDANGTMTASKYYSTTGAGSDNGMAMLKRADGGWSIIGMTNVSAPPAWDALLIEAGADGSLACNEMTPAINWVSVNAIVAPYTSSYGSGFDVYPWTMGTVSTAVGSFNPCCNETAAFTMASLGDEYTWAFTDASTGANSYHWDFGDGTTSTLPSPTHTFAANGSYTVCLTITGNCDQATACQTVSITVGIHEAGNIAGAPVVFPSPATDHFTVRSDKNLIKEIQLMDGNGRIIRSMGNVNSLHIDIPTETIPAGMYVAQVTLSNNARYHLKVMVKP